MNDKKIKLYMNDKQSNGNNALLNNVTGATRRFLLFCARNTIFQRVQRRVASVTLFKSALLSLYFVYRSYIIYFVYRS